MTKCHAGRDVRNKALKIILAVFFVAALIPLNGFAVDIQGSGDMYNKCSPELKHAPTLDEPWTTLKVCIRTSDGYYWAWAPSIFYKRMSVDNVICAPEELVWPDEEALSAERKYNTWWKNTYYKTVDGITFTIRFWDPRKESDGNYYVDIVIDQDWCEVNQKTSAKVSYYEIQGYSSKGGISSYVTFYYTLLRTSDIGNTSTYPVRTEYGKMSITGKIIDWGITGGSYYLNTNFGEGSDKLTQYNAGDEFSFTDLSCPEGDTYGDYSDFKLEQVCKVPARTYSTSTGDQDHIQTNLWCNYCKVCEDYVRAKNLTGSFDKWDKEMDLSWELE
ncbi:MAG: hypothetical protein ACI4BH_10280, partial [Muribaculaceae bacterium]